MFYFSQPTVDFSKWDDMVYDSISQTWYPKSLMPLIWVLRSYGIEP